jgi:hypothetical protein
MLGDGAIMLREPLLWWWVWCEWWAARSLWRRGDVDCDQPFTSASSPKPAALERRREGGGVALLWGCAGLAIVSLSDVDLVSVVAEELESERARAWAASASACPAEESIWICTICTMGRALAGCVHGCLRVRQVPECPGSPRPVHASGCSTASGIAS